MLFRKTILKIIVNFLIIVTFFMSISIMNVQTKVDDSNNKFADVGLLSTGELVNYIVDHELNYIYYFSDPVIGINKFKANNDYYKELIARIDAIDYINFVLKNQISNQKSDELSLLLNILEENYNDYVIENHIVLNRDNIFAPNGTAIQFAYYGNNSISPSDESNYHNAIVGCFPSLINSCVSPANDAYNCHSYAWYMQNASTNHYWIDYPNSYLSDDSYIEVYNVRAGDILCYVAYGLNYSKGYCDICEYISHSAIVVSEDGFNIHDNNTLNNVYLISKWGAYGVYVHEGDECYYGTRDSEFQYVRAFRPGTHTTVLLPTYPITNDGANIYGNGSVTQKYKMYELNADSGYYEFSVSSDKQLDVRLYDIHMQLVNINQTITGTYTNSFIENLDSGIYYLRVAYQDVSQSGTIYTSIHNHSHNYQYVNGNDICSECGYTRVHQHSYDDHYQWKNSTEHKSYCMCGSYITDFHVVSPDAYQNGNLFATCLLCNGLARFGGIIHEGIGNYPYTLNGSFILPNGIIVLVDEDFEAYMNGTLVFINPNENIDRNISFIPFVLKKEEEYLENVK